MKKPLNIYEAILDSFGGEVKEMVPSPGGLNEALGTLTFGERKVVELRYGLRGGKQGLTFQEIGRSYMGISRERVRQILVKALRKLRHPSRRDLIFYPSPMELRTLRKELDILWGKIRDLNNAVRPAIGISEETSNADIETLMVGVRVKNALRSQGVKTIGEVTRWADAELLKLRNFGKGSLRELKGALSIIEVHQSCYYLFVDLKSGTVKSIAHLFPNCSAGKECPAIVVMQDHIVKIPVCKECLARKRVGM